MSSNTMTNGSNVGISGGVTAKQIIGTDLLSSVVFLSAPKGNTFPVFFNTTSTVTISDGFPLYAGQSVSLPLQQPEDIYCVTESGVQTIDWIVV